MHEWACHNGHPGKKGQQRGPHKARHITTGVTKGKQGTVVSHPPLQIRCGRRHWNSARILLSDFNAATKSVHFHRLNARGKKGRSSQMLCSNECKLGAESVHAIENSLIFDIKYHPANNQINYRTLHWAAPKCLTSPSETVRGDKMLPLWSSLNFGTCIRMGLLLPAAGSTPAPTTEAPLHQLHEHTALCNIWLHWFAGVGGGGIGYMSRHWVSCIHICACLHIYIRPHIILSRDLASALPSHATFTKAGSVLGALKLQYSQSKCSQRSSLGIWLHTLSAKQILPNAV